jgi:hypothetical protein
MKDLDKKIRDFATKYFELLDKGADVKELLDFFDTDDFIIVEGEDVIDTKEMYTNWYNAVVANIVQRKHIIKKIETKHIQENLYLAMIIINFSANSTNGEPIAFEGNINWILKLDENEKFAITEYQINT